MNNQSYQDLCNRIHELAKIETFHRGAAVQYQDIARHLPATIDPRFIANQCELAGCPVWTSCPDEAFKFNWR